jgi:hypothetical protein
MLRVAGAVEIFDDMRQLPAKCRPRRWIFEGLAYI